MRIFNTFAKIVIAAATCLTVWAGVTPAQQIGVFTPTFSTYGPQGTVTFITPYVATQPGAVTTWKGNFTTSPFNGLPAVPAGIQLKIFRQISPTQVQVVSVGQLHDPRSAVQAIPLYPNFATDAGIVEFAESNVSLLAGDIVGLTLVPDPAVTLLDYTLVSGSDTRVVLHDVVSGDTVDLSDPFTGTLPGEVPAILINTALNVTIDVKPGSYPNSINLSSAGVVPVAIFSTNTFDATSIDPDSLFLAGASVGMIGKSGNLLCSVHDVNGDGLTDLVCQFQTAQLSLQPGDTVAVLVGKTFGGVAIRGQDTVNIVPD